MERIGLQNCGYAGHQRVVHFDTHKRLSDRMPGHIGDNRMVEVKINGCPVVNFSAVRQIGFLGDAERDESMRRHFVHIAVGQSDGVENKVVLAKGRLAQLGTDEYSIIETMKGSDLVGRSYQPPFDHWQVQEFENKQNAWKIYHADYVELGEEGTGAVHLAPAYGDEDMQLAKQHNIPILHHVDSNGHFKEFVRDFNCDLNKAFEKVLAEKALSSIPKGLINQLNTPRKIKHNGERIYKKKAPVKCQTDRPEV